MKQVTKTLLIIVSVVLIAFGSWYFINQSSKKADLSADNYSADEELIAQVRARVWQFDKSVQTQIAQGIDGSPDIISFIGGSFPMTKIVEKRTGDKKTPTKFDATERTANRILIQKLITKYDNLVSDASKRFSIPKLLIYVIMAVENTEGDPLSGLKAKYVGLMQISAGNAADSLVTQKKRRLLTVEDLKYFQKRFGTGVFSNQNLVSNTDLSNAETNINVGTLHLSEQIVDNKFDINKDLHKIIFSYNRGKNRTDNDGTKNLGIDALINHYLAGGQPHSTGAEYVIRALGPNGAADILVNDLGINS